MLIVAIDMTILPLVLSFPFFFTARRAHQPRSTSATSSGAEPHGSNSSSIGVQFDQHQTRLMTGPS
jgi:hypothetical protein